MSIAPSASRFEDTACDPPVRGFLHSPECPPRDCLVLTHGAGSNAQAPLLIALATKFAEAGFTVLRCDLPYRQQRSFGPPRPGDAARDRDGLRNAVSALRNLVSGRVFLGGHSYGGRQSSMLAADDDKLVSGLLLTSYPLHPPARREQVRVQHFPNLSAPVVFVHGTRDPFASIEELEAARKLIPGGTKLLAVEGVGHDLGFSRKVAPSVADLPKRVLEVFLDLIHSI